MSEPHQAAAIEWDGDDADQAFRELVSDYSLGPDQALDIHPVQRGLSEADCSFEVLRLRCDGPFPEELLGEARRALKPGGTLVAIVAGESHRIELQEIFGRGANWPPAKPVRFAIPEKLRQAGLDLISFAEYYGARYYENAEDCASTLGPGSVVPDFDADKDAIFVREIRRMLTTDRGIRETEHWAVFVARRPEPDPITKARNPEHTKRGYS